ncbi:MAG: hypothetical protein KY393_02840 [Actinobacteria bacterium]|nr:hypothetical protein [Actinomycetota bacterium]
MPEFAYWGLVTLQVIIAVFLIFLMVRLVRIIRSQGGTIVPPQLSEKMKKKSRRKGR